VNTRAIGLLHPGEMGAAIGRCLTNSGHAVLWASEGRSAASQARAKEAGLTDAGTVADVASQAGIILSVCPPHAATDVAWAVHGFRGLYVDANAISPGTAREEGVEDTLLAEWALSQPSLGKRSRGSAKAAGAKGWRWVAEMEEIAATMAAAGLPDGFHQAAAEIFRRYPRSSADG